MQLDGERIADFKAAQELIDPPTPEEIERRQIIEFLEGPPQLAPAAGLRGELPRARLSGAPPFPPPGQGQDHQAQGVRVMLADETLCTGTTHPTCEACARKAWPASRRLDEGGSEQWICHINPPIVAGTGYCPEFRAKEH